MICNVPNCETDSTGPVKTESGTELLLCEWHTYELKQNLGWLGKSEEEDINTMFPPITKPDDLKDDNRGAVSQP